MARDIYFTPVYDRWTQKKGILVDHNFIDQIRLDIYERKLDTSLSAIELLDYLSKTVTQAESKARR